MALDTGNPASVTFTVNGQVVTVPAEGTLLTALRERPRATGSQSTGSQLILQDLVSVKDGCAPQGQCGCCTVWVDGEPRVSCVTPVARVDGRSVTTLEGLDESVREAWSQALCATGGSQCGFCTPGIIMRLAAKIPESLGNGRDFFRAQGSPETELRDPELRDPELRDAELRDTVNTALLAHLCRCTGWQTIHEAAVIVAERDIRDRDIRERDIRDRDIRDRDIRDYDRASRRATIEGGATQIVHPRVALGAGGFADDLAPAGSLVAILAPDRSWVVGEDAASARRAAGVVQGRKSSVRVTWPIDVPVEINPEPGTSGGFIRALKTTWVDPAYLEPDAVWCVPGGEPVGPLKNGGAFGGKTVHESPVHESPVHEIPVHEIPVHESPVHDLRDVARRLADEHGRPVRVLLSREDVVRLAPKRPPMALAVRADGSGELWAVSTPGLRELIGRVAPDWDVHEVGPEHDVSDGRGPGLRTSLSLRAAGWAEVAIMRSSVRDPEELNRGQQDASQNNLYSDHVVAPNGAQAWAGIRHGGSDTDGDEIFIRVQCGAVLDATVLRSYCIGAAHMALGWVRSEGIAVDEGGHPLDLTMRSFGVLRAIDTPRFHVEIVNEMSVNEMSVNEISVNDVTVNHSDGDGLNPVNGSDAVFAAVAAAVWRNAGFPSAWPCDRDQ